MDLCFCASVSAKNTRTKVSFIIHVKELRLTSNTARLCALALNNSKIFVRGSQDQQNLESYYTPTLRYHQLYLYPTPNSVPLTQIELESETPIELVVPDASWNQAKKFHQREPVFQSMQQVHLAELPPSRYQLRKQKYPGGVCTLEAVAYALEIIEGAPIKDHLFEILNIMNIHHLKGRGQS